MYFLGIIVYIYLNRLYKALLKARKQYEQGNEKLYLKQQYDTASLVNIAHRLFLAMERFDSIDAAPDKTGKSKPEYRKKHADLLNTLRPNLYNGALFLIGKQKYDEAYNYLDTYIDCANRPMFRSYAYSEKDTVMPQAAYWAVYCGYRMRARPSTTPIWL